MKCSWPLGSGKSLLFVAYPPDSTWNSVAGLYIFARLIDTSGWNALCIGKTDDFSARLSDHERWDSAARLGATHIHVRVVPLEANRDIYERLLISSLQPPLNRLLR